MFVYQKVYVELMSDLKKHFTKLKIAENNNEIQPSCLRAYNSVILPCLLIIIIQNVFVYSTQILSKYQIPALLNEDTTWPKSGIPIFQNDVQTYDVSEKQQKQLYSP